MALFYLLPIDLNFNSNLFSEANLKLKNKMPTIKQLSNSNILQIAFLCSIWRHQPIILGFVILVVDVQASSSHSVALQSK